MPDEDSLSIAGVRITHASRSIYSEPPLTKRAVVAHLARAAALRALGVQAKAFRSPDAA